VIHPEMDYGYGRTQEDFTYTNATDDGEDYEMLNFAGYWVYMNSDKTLAAGATSYVWDESLKGISKLISLTDSILNSNDFTTP
jgi:hypothetical protein